jgi:hypothetical protein
VARGFLLSQGTATGILTQAIQHLSAPTPSQWQHIRHTNCVAAIQHLPQAVTRIEFGSQQIRTTNSGLMVISGLDVSVRPEVGLIRERPDGAFETGAVKLYFSKDRPLTAEAGSNIAVALQWYMERAYSSWAIAPDLCQVLDVFAEQVWTPPQRQDRRRDNIAAACREILTLWDGPRLVA